MRALLVVLAVCAGCRCQDARQEAARRDAIGADAAAGFGRAEVVDPAEQAIAPPEEVVPPAPEPSIEELGAIGAWDAVVDRARYLARRGDRGIVYGRVDGAVDGGGLVWLIDEREGGGALAIRVRLPNAVAPGARIAIRGAWKVDDANRWYWDADQVTPLPPSDAPAPAYTGHAIAVESPPGGWSGVRSPDVVKDGELVAFTVVEKPRQEGDGWGVSDRRWGTLMAYVRLPGERASYGGHDLRAADERWALKQGGTYWARVGKVRRRAGQLPVIEAVTAPVRFP